MTEKEMLEAFILKNPSLKNATYDAYGLSKDEDRLNRNRCRICDECEADCIR